MKILTSKRDALTKTKRSLLSKQIIFFSNRYKNPVILIFYSPLGFISALFRSVGREFSNLLFGYLMDTNLGVVVFLDTPQGYVLLPLSLCVHLGT